MTREEAISILKDRSCTDCSAMCGYPLENSEGECEYSDAIRTAIEALESKQQWIPCSERLPENNGQYLISTNKGAVYVVRRSFGRWGSSFRNCVTAWQPLPDPYEEVEQDD